MKKILIFILSLLFVVGGILGYKKYKLISVENAVNRYLNTDAKIPEKFIESKPFIANRPGNKNWMVSVKIKGDSKTYYYYKNAEGKIVLEFYNNKGVEKFLDKIMN